MGTEEDEEEDEVQGRVFMVWYVASGLKGLWCGG